jgi:hypothetical protein
MAFNSNSYHRNAYRRKAIAELTEARRHKATTGDSYWIASAAKRARLSWRLYLIRRRICELSSRAAPYVPQPFTTRESSHD